MLPIVFGLVLAWMANKIDNNVYAAYLDAISIGCFWLAFSLATAIVDNDRLRELIDQYVKYFFSPANGEKKPGDS